MRKPNPSLLCDQIKEFKHTYHSSPLCERVREWLSDLESRFLDNEIKRQESETSLNPQTRVDKR